ncbi:MAG: alkaline shock response membrane anchor protein AmaP [Oscillospiraceae bacterium]|nr:alkaline shock response membrane anchor protein AmaP [Oscillospiraceae bacterium]
MRIKWYDRLLIAVSSVILLALGAFVILTAYQVPPIGDVGARLIMTLRVPGLTYGVTSWTWITIAIMTVIGVVLIVWAIRQIISIIPKKTRQHFYNAKEMENGRLSISLTALEHLVTRCLSNHTEFANSHIRITGDEDTARVSIRSTITGGASMPKSTAALQKEIVDHLSDYAGITVKSVDVIVEDTRLPGQLPPFEQKQLPQADDKYSVTPPVAPSPYSILTGGAKAKPTPEPRADSIFGLVEDEAEAEEASEDAPIEYKDDPTLEDSIESVAQARLEDIEEETDADESADETDAGDENDSTETDETAE